MVQINNKGFRLTSTDRLDKDYYLNNGSIAYYSSLNGIEIYDINDDYVLCTSNAWNNRKYLKWHQVKLYTNLNGDSYFIINGYRIPLSECLRTHF